MEAQSRAKFTLKMDSSHNFARPDYAIIRAMIAIIKQVGFFFLLKQNAFIFLGTSTRVFESDSGIFAWVRIRFFSG